MAGDSSKDDQVCQLNHAGMGSYAFRWSVALSAGETLAFCHSVGVENLGVTLDIGHSIQAGEQFNLVMKGTRKLESITWKLDRGKIMELMQERNPNNSIEYLYDTLLKN